MTDVKIILKGEPSEMEALELASYNLRDELNRAGLASHSELVTVPFAKGVGDWKTILVALGSTGAAIPVLMNCIRDWLPRQKGIEIKVKIGQDEFSIKDASSREADQLIRDWKKKHEKS